MTPEQVCVLTTRVCVCVCVCVCVRACVCIQGQEWTNVQPNFDMDMLLIVCERLYVFPIF